MNIPRSFRLAPVALFFYSVLAATTAARAEDMESADFKTPAANSLIAAVVKADLLKDGPKFAKSVRLIGRVLGTLADQKDADKRKIEELQQDYKTSMLVCFAMLADSTPENHQPILNATRSQIDASLAAAKNPGEYVSQLKEIAADLKKVAELLGKRPTTPAASENRRALLHNDRASADIFGASETAGDAFAADAAPADDLSADAPAADAVSPDAVSDDAVSDDAVSDDAVSDDAAPAAGPPAAAPSSPQSIDVVVKEFLKERLESVKASPTASFSAQAHADDLNAFANLIQRICEGADESSAKKLRERIREKFGELASESRMPDERIKFWGALHDQLELRIKTVNPGDNSNLETEKAIWISIVKAFREFAPQFVTVAGKAPPATPETRAESFRKDFWKSTLDKRQIPLIDQDVLESTKHAANAFRNVASAVGDNETPLTFLRAWRKEQAAFLDNLRNRSQRTRNAWEDVMIDFDNELAQPQAAPLFAEGNAKALKALFTEAAKEIQGLGGKIDQDHQKNSGNISSSQTTAGGSSGGSAGSSGGGSSFADVHHERVLNRIYRRTDRRGLRVDRVRARR